MYNSEPTVALLPKSKEVKHLYSKKYKYKYKYKFLFYFFSAAPPIADLTFREA